MNNQNRLFLFYILIFLISLNSCSSIDSDKQVSEEVVLPTIKQVDLPLADLSFSSTIIELGDIIDTATVHGFFQFENISDNPAQITRVNSSCKSTVPIYPKNSLTSGIKSKIYFEFTPNKVLGNKSEYQTRTITLEGNFKEIKLEITAIVLASD